MYAIKGLHENYIKELKKDKNDIKREREFISQWIHNLKGNLNVIDLIVEKSNLTQSLKKVISEKSDEFIYNNVYPKFELHCEDIWILSDENGRKCKNSTRIGLYLCHTICENLGHTISIASEVSKGTEVTISYLAKMKD